MGKLRMGKRRSMRRLMIRMVGDNDEKDADEKWRLIVRRMGGGDKL